MHQIKLMELKEEISNLREIKLMGRTVWNIINETEELNIFDTMDIYRSFCLTAVVYTFFPRTHETFSRLEYHVDHKTSLNEFKRTEIIQSVFSTT